jgi:hypothetical protein
MREPGDFELEMEGCQPGSGYPFQGDPFPDIRPPSELPSFLMHEKQLVRLDGTLIWHAIEPQGVVFEWEPEVPVEGPVLLRARHLPGGAWLVLGYWHEGYPGALWTDGDLPGEAATALRNLEGWQGGETEFVAAETMLAGDDDLERRVRAAFARGRKEGQETERARIIALMIRAQ